jgi:hypothetical protein
MFLETEYMARTGAPWCSRAAYTAAETKCMKVSAGREKRNSNLEIEETHLQLQMGQNPGSCVIPLVETEHSQ